MSYKGYDKWDVHGGELCENSPSLKELKRIIIDHIKSFQITKSETCSVYEDYEITKVSVVIRKKK